MGPPTVPILLSIATFRRSDVIFIIDSANKASSSIGNVATDCVMGCKYSCCAFATIWFIIFGVALESFPSTSFFLPSINWPSSILWKIFCICFGISLASAFIKPSFIPNKKVCITSVWARGLIVAVLSSVITTCSRTAYLTLFEIIPDRWMCCILGKISCSPYPANAIPTYPLLKKSLLKIVHTLAVRLSRTFPIIHGNILEICSLISPL